MAKEKKPLTPTQQKKKLKAISFACKFGQWGSLIAPFVTIGIVNFNDYFVEYDGWKVSIAGILAAFVMGVVVFTIVNQKIKNSYGVLIIKVAIITAILFLIERLVYDLKYIMLFTLIGIFGALALEKTSEKLDNKAGKIQEGIESAEKRMTEEAYLDEVKEKEEKKTIKIKVRKDE